LKFLFNIATSHVADDVFASPYQVRELMIVYGAGFSTIYICFAALYANAWRQRLHLRLSAVENTLTLCSLWDYVGIAILGLVCCLLSVLLPVDRAGFAPLSFLLIPIWKTIHGKISARRVRMAHTRTTPEDRLSLSHHG
jgi:hypothetical protein